MDNNQKFDSIWDGFKKAYKDAKENRAKAQPVTTPLDLLTAETQAVQVIRLYENEAHSFKSALKSALKSEMPIPYAKVPSYNPMIIEDFREVLKELYGIDFEFTIKTDNQLVEA